MNAYDKSRYTIVQPIEDRGEDMVALYNTLTRGFLLVLREDWVALLRGDAKRATPETVELFRSQGIIVPSGVDESAVCDNHRYQHVYDASTIKSKVIYTRECNNACAYCFLDPEPETMSPEAARAMDRFLFSTLKNGHAKRVSDEGSGGEVMLNSGVLLDAATRRYHFCLGRDIHYSLGIVTNGTLLNRPIIERLREVGLNRVRVSVAGPAEIHDRLRPARGGGGTYETILSNLASISGMVSITVECQYDAGSEDYLTIPQMLEDFVRYGIDVESINFCPILRTRTMSPYQAGVGDPGPYLYLTREATSRGYPQFDTAISNRCAADFRRHYVFDTDGSIIPCPALQKGEMAYGDVWRGIDFVRESELRKRDLQERCRLCEFLPACFGGCRLQPLAIRNDFHGIDCRYEMLRAVTEEYMVRQARKALAEDREDAGGTPIAPARFS